MTEGVFPNSRPSPRGRVGVPFINRLNSVLDSYIASEHYDFMEVHYKARSTAAVLYEGLREIGWDPVTWSTYQAALLLSDCALRLNNQIARARKDNDMYAAFDLFEEARCIWNNQYPHHLIRKEHDADNTQNT